jgi:membrane protease YdiL (CAAX protease family)
MVHFSTSALVQHALFLFLAVIAPLLEYPAMRRLKRDPTSARKLGVYRLICIWLWVATAIAVAAVGWRPLFTIDVRAGEIGWFQHDWVRGIFATIILLFAVVLLLPVAVVLWKRIKNIPRKYANADALKSLSFFLPATWAERRWWTTLSITAGFCEELLFRGFLLRYLHIYPATLSLTLALLIASVVFGVHHLYQGLPALFSTSVLGILFGLLFVLTGSLLLPMLLHVAMDLRMLVIVRPPAADIAQGARAR